MIKNFFRPADLKEALTLKGNGVQFLAGGTEINRGATGLGSGNYQGDEVMPGIPLRTADMDVIYLDGLDLKGFRTEGEMFIIGACTTLQEIMDEPSCPDVLKCAAAFIPSRSIRNMATIGGNIVASRANSAMLPALLALDAVIFRGDKTGSVKVEEYINKGCNDLITEIGIPESIGVCFTVKESRSHLAVPVVTVAVYMEKKEGAVSIARIALGCECTGPLPGRLTGVEESLIGKSPASREELAELVEKAVVPPGGILGTGEYRSRINGIKTADLISKCWEVL